MSLPPFDALLVSWASNSRIMNSSGASPGFFENIWTTYIEQPNLQPDQKWSDFQIVAIGSFCLKLLLIFGCATIPLTFHFFPALHQYKIQQVSCANQQKVYYDLSTFWKGYKSIIMTHAFGIVRSFLTFSRAL